MKRPVLPAMLRNFLFCFLKPAQRDALLNLVIIAFFSLFFLDYRAL